MPPKKQIKFKVKPKAEMEAKPKAKKPIKFKVVKKEEKKEEPKKKKAIKFKVKPKPKTVGKTGMTKEEFNKLDPAEAFGKLPALAKLKILTGDIKVGKPPLNNEQLNAIDSIVDRLVGAEYYFRTLSSLEIFADNDNFSSSQVAFLGKQSEKALKIGRKLAEKQKKFFSKKLIEKLDKMHGQGLLRGYEYLNDAFGENEDFDNAIAEMAENREDYYLADNLGMTQDGNYEMSPTKSMRSKVKEYLNEYKEFAKRLENRMKDYKSIQNGAG